MTNIEIVEKFYNAFQKQDGETMASLYADDAHFSDPVFENLRGDEIGDMWRMLTAQAKDFSLEYRNVRSEGNVIRVHWEAKYLFSKTGRKIHNRIEAEITIKDGKIIRHRDRFSLYKWFRMALGMKGLLVGWLPFAARALREEASRNLRLFRIDRKKQAKKAK